MQTCILRVALDTPLDSTFDYRWTVPPGQAAPMPGQLAIVPFGKREMAGLILEVLQHTDVPSEKLRDAQLVHTDVPPLSADWRALCQFAASYYQRPFGEVALPALPKNLRSANTASLNKARKKLAPTHSEPAATGGVRLPLNADQAAAVEAVAGANGFVPTLLFGITGSGKTEVYLQAAARIFEQSSASNPPPQVLILVPEINLTPQLQATVAARFPALRVATLHSGLAEGERLAHWYAAHCGQAQIVLGTRLAVLASLPRLRLIIVDEEHDASYKQQEGLRYSARDLAIWRARQLAIPIVLGSATPSLETWQHAQSGRYRRLALRERASPNAVLPAMQLIDTERDKPSGGLTSTLVAAMRRRLECGEQSLLFLNRRGYAPVLHCDACGWVSGCAHCTAFMVLHKPEHRLRCHHCSAEARIPKSCPTCGNVDLQPLGRGTQRVEESLQQLFPAARLLRIDADSTRKKGSAQAAFEAVHAGQVDILIGTQMVAKGHDFQKLTLVGVLNPDTALFSQDYRADERLFAQLMQVAGRAGRAAKRADGNASQVLIQTRYPQHPLYAALLAHDYPRFAAQKLDERRATGLPPFVFQALLRAEARQLDQALAFLEQARGLLAAEGVILHDPIPMTMARLANAERAQLLVESASRALLQQFLKSWIEALRAVKTRVKWTLEVDPNEI